MASIKNPSLPDGLKPAIEGGIPVRETFLVFGRPSLEQSEIDEVIDTLKSGWIGTGPKVTRFEERFRQYKDAKCATAVSSCTAALHLSLLALGIHSGDEVITTPLTFCATVNAILHAGARPVFADCDRRSMNIDPAQIEKKITGRTKALVPVHFAGRPCDMNSIVRIARTHGLKIIEDCAHAIETEYAGQKAGTFGEAGCFSFYVTKNVVTAEGGMVLCQNKSLDEKIKVLALHGMSKDAWKRFSDSGYKHYGIEVAGFKYNMTDIQASIGLHQLARVHKNWLIRQKIWIRYNEAFRDLPCITPAESEPRTTHAYHLYTLLIDLENIKVDRDYLLNAFIRENIGVGVHYMALNTYPFYQEVVKNGKDYFPNAEFISKRTLSLPLSPSMSKADVESVITAVRKLLIFYKKVHRETAKSLTLKVS